MHLLICLLLVHDAVNSIFSIDILVDNDHLGAAWSKREARQKQSRESPLKDLSQFSKNLTYHARKRVQQRGFKQADIDLLMDSSNHKEKRQKGGGVILYFTKAGKKIASKLGIDPRMYIVFNLNSKQIITVCHGYPHHRLKNY